MSKTTHFDSDGYEEEPRHLPAPPPKSPPPPHSEARRYFSSDGNSSDGNSSDGNSSDGNSSDEAAAAEMCGLIPLTWRGMTFWGTAVDGVLVQLETYGSPIGGYSYRLIHDSEHRALTDGWRFEMWDFGEMGLGGEPRAILSDHPPLKRANFIELVAAMAVLAAEGSPPSVMANSRNGDISKLVKRWANWMRMPPDWADGVTLGDDAIFLE